MTLIRNVLIIRFMKNLIIVCLLIIGVITVGCSSGGGGSKPSSNLSGPTISYISPVSGNSDTLITIYGSRFGLYQGSSILSYGGVTVTPSSWQDTQITVKLPTTSLPDQKFLVNVGGIFSNESTPFAFSDMRVFNITPSNGSPGSIVTISGQGFGTFVSGVTYVTFYDLSQAANYSVAAVSTWSDTSITCTVPTSLSISQSGSIGFTVWKSSTIYANGNFNLTVPTISSIDPAIDNVGATISISGQGFGNTQGSSYVRIGGSHAPVVSWSDNLVRVRVPDFSFAGQKTVELTINNRTISSNSFSVAGPQINSYYPAGTIGYDDTFTIYGSHFGIAADFEGSGAVTRSIEISGSGVYHAVTSVLSWSDTSISFKWPISNTLGTRTFSVTVKIGNYLSSTISNITAD